MADIKNHHSHAFSCFKTSFPLSLMLSASLLAAWGLFLFIAMSAYKAWSLASLFLIFPLLLALFLYRFYIISKLHSIVTSSDVKLKPFSSLIPAALYRIFSGALWLLPFAFLLYQLYRYVFILPATTFSNDFTAIGALISADASASSQMMIGTGVFFTLLFLAFFLHIYGWRRGMSFDISQCCGLSFSDSLRYAGRIRKSSVRTRISSTILHAMMLIPAVILPLLLPYSQLAPLLTGKAMNDIQLIYAYLSIGIVSSGTLIISLCIFLVLYLPLLPFRKLDNISAMVISNE